MPVVAIKKTIHACCPSVLKPTLAKIEASEIGSRLAGGAFWSAIGAIVSKGSALAASIVIARMLGREVFGELGIIRGTIGMFGIFSGFGLSLTATKHVAEFRDRNVLRAGHIIALSSLVAIIAGGAMAVLLAISAPWLATHTLAASHLRGPLRVSSLLLLLNSLIGAQTGVLIGFTAFRAIAVRDAWTAVSTFLFMMTGAHLSGVSGAVWGLVAGMVVNWVLCHAAIRSECTKAGISIVFKKCWREWPILLKFSLPAFFSSAMVGPVMWGCSALLVNRNAGYQSMGTYSAAYSFHIMMVSVGTVVAAPLLPMIAARGQSTSRSLEKINMLSSWMLGVCFALPLLAFPELGQVLYGERFEGPTFRKTLVLVVVFTCVAMYKQGLSRVLVARGLLWWSLLSNGLWAIIAAGAAAVMTRWGSSGLAASLVTAYTVNVLLFIPFYAVRKLVPQGTLISKEASLIWLTIGGLGLTAFFQVPMIVRAFLFIGSVLVAAYSFRRLLRRG